MADYYFDKKTRNEVGHTREEGISKNEEKEKQENNVQKYRDIDSENIKEYRRRYEDTSFKNNEKERQENDVQKYKDTDSENNIKEYRQGYGDTDSENIKEYRQGYGDTSPEGVEKEHQPKEWRGNKGKAR